MNLRTTRPTLEFAKHQEELTGGLSAVLHIGRELWVANDELTSVERLTLRSDGEGFDNHRSFELQGLLNLPAFGQKKPGGKKGIDQEIDIEGLDFDGGYLWLVGSHSVKRKKIDEGDKEDGDAKNIKKLSKCEAEGNRYLLARVPVLTKTGESILADVSSDASLKAAQLPGTLNGNSLINAILEEDEEGRPDSHLSPWLTLPGKDNGFDIEGLVVRGERLFLGLRGPVLRGWTVILELQLKRDDNGNSVPELKLKRIGPDGRAYRRHFLDLGGLGVRDLCADGEDLLILAGPTMTHDGPVRVFRWAGGLKKNMETVVWGEDLKKRALTIPHGAGADRAEGIALVAGATSPSLLVVYDAASDERKIGDNIVCADIFELP